VIVACIIVGLVVAVAIAFLALRKIGSQDWHALAHSCLTNEGLKFFAFCGATGAGVAMSAYLVWNTAYLHAAKKDDYVFYLAAGSMLLLGLTQLSLHRLLGAKQAIEIEFWKLKAKLSQGDDLLRQFHCDHHGVFVDHQDRDVSTPKPAEPPAPAEEPFNPGGGA
jgi:hypothetical protein